jgi:hypothetical protein
MRLNDLLVTSFVYDGKEYNIDLSFDNVLDVFDVLSDDTLRDYEKAEICLELLLGEQGYTSTVELWNHIYKEYIEIQRKQPIEYDLKGNPMPVQDEDSEKMIDLEQDAEYVYASFRQAYGMNLYEQQGKLHWHEFKALLNGLPSDTIMQRVIQIRLWKPSKHESGAYKENMRKLQKIYALDDNEE